VAFRANLLAGLALSLVILLYVMKQIEVKSNYLFALYVKQSMLAKSDEHGCLKEWANSSLLGFKSAGNHFLFGCYRSWC